MQDPQEAADVLVKFALSNASLDNISVMVVRFCHDRTTCGVAASDEKVEQALLAAAAELSTADTTDEQ